MSHTAPLADSERLPYASETSGEYLPVEGTVVDRFLEVPVLHSFASNHVGNRPSDTQQRIAPALREAELRL